MTKVLMHGACGAMGKVIAQLAAQTEDVVLVAGVDLRSDETAAFPIYRTLSEVQEAFDVIIDFSLPAAVDALLDYCEAKAVPAVICTTGLSEAQLARIQALSEKTALLRSANMSLGVNLLLKLVQDAARTLYAQGFDIEIVEQHHHRKKDAPSGTALALADSVNEALGGQLHYVYDRSERSAARAHEELGISAVRGGSIVGVHDVIFAGEDEVLTLNHTAYSRAIFAKGAIAAACWLKDKKAGLYSMQNVIGG